MAKILLIFPHPGGVFPRIPTSILPLAGYLLQKGIDVEIFDQQVSDVNEIDPKAYDLIGFSIAFTSKQILSALDIAKRFKNEGVKLPFIWGGVHPTITPEETIRNRYVDIIVRGEGEETLYELIKVLSSSQQLEKVKGITFKKNAKIISTADRDFIDLNELPLLPYHLLKNFDKYSELSRTPPMAPMMTSRGCPFSCGFCYNKAVNRQRFRAMSPDRVVREMKHAIKFFGVSLLTFYEDNMFTSRERMEKTAHLIIDEGLRIKWTGSIRFDMAAELPDEFWRLMMASGFYNPSFGGESGSTRILNMLDKKMSVDDMKSTIRNLKRYDNIQPYANYMFGIPHENQKDVKKTFELIDVLSKENKRLFCGISIYTPYPKTPLYAEAIRLGFSPPSTLEEWGNYQYNEVSNLPWVKGHLKSMLKTVALFTHFKFNQLFMPNIDLPEKNFFYKAAKILLTLSSQLRWRFKFFWFPLEWRLYEKILRTIGIVER